MATRLSLFALIGLVAFAGCGEGKAPRQYTATDVVTTLDAQIEDGVNVVWCEAFAKGVGGAGGEFVERVRFAEPFEPTPYRLEFEGVPVKTFGYVAGSARRVKLEGEIKVYGSPTSPTVELTTAGGDRLVLARLECPGTLASAVDEVMLSLKSDPLDLDARGVDQLVAPVVDFDLSREVNGVRVRASLAIGREATGPAGDEIMRSWSSPDDTAVIDGPFLVMLLAPGAERPRFAMWVANSEVMPRAPTHFPYAEIGPAGDGLIRVSTERSYGFFSFERPIGNCGFIDLSGRVVIPPRFADAHPFDSGVAPAAAPRPDRDPDDVAWGLIDRTGKWAVSPRFGEMHAFHDGLAAALDRPRRTCSIFEAAGKPSKADNTSEPKWGFVDHRGRWAVPPRYQSVVDFADGVAEVTTFDNETRFIDTTGREAKAPPRPPALDFDEKDGREWVVDEQHRFLCPVPEGFEPRESRDPVVLVQSPDRLRLLDRRGRTLVEVPGGAGYLLGEAGGIAQLTATGLFGFIDVSGRKVIDAQFSDVQPFCEGLALVRVKDRWGFVDRAGKLVVAPQWDDACSFSEGLAAVELDQKWGFVDKTGRVALAPQWDDACSFSEGLAAVQLDQKWGYVDKTGRVAIAPRFAWAYSFQGGKAKASVDPNVRWVDRSGRETTAPEDPYGSVFKNFEFGISAFGDRNGRCGFMDAVGRELVKPTYDRASGFRDGLAAVSLGGKWGFLDHAFKWAIRPQFDEAEDFADGRAFVRVGARWFHIDKAGKRITPEDWDSFGEFSEGLAIAGPPTPGFIVLPGGKVVRVPGLVVDRCYFAGTPNDEWDVPRYGKVQEDYLGPSDGATLVVRTVEGVGFMDLSSRWVIPPRYQEAYPFVEGLAGVRIGGRWGYIDRTGRVVIRPQFDYVGSFFHGVAAVGIGETHVSESGSRWGLIDRAGRFLTTAEGGGRDLPRPAPRAKDAPDE